MQKNPSYDISENESKGSVHIFHRDHFFKHWRSHILWKCFWEVHTRKHCMAKTKMLFLWSQPLCKTLIHPLIEDLRWIGESYFWVWGQNHGGWVNIAKSIFRTFSCYLITESCFWAEAGPRPRPRSTLNAGESPLYCIAMVSQKDLDLFSKPFHVI